MGWRLLITVDPRLKDFVFSLGPMAIVALLELLLSFIIVSLAALAPLFRKYIEPLISKVTGKTGSGRGNLQEAQHTIGGTPAKDQSRRRNTARKAITAILSWRNASTSVTPLGRGRARTRMARGCQT